ncbi:30S ribosomal protein S18 [Capsicum chinense]|nr:30S ribosomal protein S18 [Capsicum chinense]
MDTTFLVATQPLMISKTPTHLSPLKTLKDEFWVIVRVTGQVQTPFSESSVRLKKAYDRSGLGSMFGSGNRSSILDGLGESFNTLSDGMDGKLKEAANYFAFDPNEVEKEDYAYRADMTFWPGNTYELKNVRFLTNFITEAGILVKRSKTGISAKAQRKIAREIKTARAFGLMPFTTMGTKQFVFGRTMEDLDAAILSIQKLAGNPLLRLKR